jgi:membrane-bound lytic murein transglycosylase C
MKKRVLSILLLATISLQASSIEEILASNRAYISEVMSSNEEFNTALMESNAKYIKEIVAKEWGSENVKLSSKKSITIYDSLTKRKNIDYENESVTIEYLVDVDEDIDDSSIKDDIKKLEKITTKDVIKKDPTLKKENVAKSLISIKPVENLIDKDSIKKETKIVTLADGTKKKIIRANIKMVKNAYIIKAQKYLPTITKYSQKYQIPKEYILATISVESAFRPYARSHAGAIGLMQVVPSTAGKDIYNTLYGKDKIPTIAYLSDVDNNIKFGTKYISIISTSYLRGVSDNNNLRYSTAVSYNGGIGMLTKAMVTNPKESYKKRKPKAIKNINSKSNKELYNHLTTYKRVPKESREYLIKIENMYQKYKKVNLDEI